MYHLIVEKYPANLITEDRWGATPLLYAFWGSAPVKIVNFLIDRYQSLYPDYVFNWTMMVETMGRCHTPKETIESLLFVQNKCITQSRHLIGSIYSLSLLVLHHDFRLHCCFKNRCVIYSCAVCQSMDVEALALKVWRDYVTNMIHTATFVMGRDNSAILREIRIKFAHYEDKFTKLKEATAMLELALWKMKMNEKGHQDRATQTQSQKKMKADESNVRCQTRVTYGADFIIIHVVPYLINWKLRMNDNNISTEEATHHQTKNESSMRIQCRITCGADVIIRHVLLFLISVD